METKICKKCGNEKLITEFHKNKKNKTQMYCKSCAIAISKTWYQNNKKTNEIKSILYSRVDIRSKYHKMIINKVKEIYGCCVCGEKDPCCIDFHHLNETHKNKNVSYWVDAKSIQKTIEEITKCICVCSNCHRKIHAKKIQPPNVPISIEEITVLIEKLIKLNPMIKTKIKINKPKTYKRICDICKNPTNNKKYCSPFCHKNGIRKVERPSFEKLKEDIQNMSMCAVGKKYNVSDNAIRKWIKYYKKMTPVGLAPTSTA